MSKQRQYPETKRNLRMVIDVMNADFTKEHVSGQAKYLIDAGLSREKAADIQRRVLAAHKAGTVVSLKDDFAEYANVVEWVPTPDGRSLRMLSDISLPESTFFVALVTVITDGKNEFFWRLKRCAQCSKFFLPRPKQRYCCAVCLDKHNSETAQERVERGRRNRRFKEVLPRLLKLQQLAKSTPLPEIFDKLVGFDAKLLALIIEGKKPLNELASEVKYKNRRILIKAKI